MPKFRVCWRCGPQSSRCRAVGWRGSYRYIGYTTDPNPTPEQAEAARRDNTATAQESGYAQVEGTGWSIQLSYKDGNNGAVRGYIFVVPVELWEEVRVSSTSFDVELGRNSRYVFTADMWKNPFSEGADYELFNEMSFPAQDMIAMATVTEPK